MRRLIFIAIFSLITHDAGTVFAQNSPQLSSDVAARADRVFKRWDKPDSPGCALGVYKDGQIVYKRGYGMPVETVVFEDHSGTGLSRVVFATCNRPNFPALQLVPRSETASIKS